MQTRNWSQRNAFFSRQVLGFFMRKIVQDKLFLFLSLLIIAYRLYILFRYNIHFTDDDQACMWYGSAVFSHLIFPEPCFFGQAYGSMLESLAAVPLIWLKVPFYIALPLATHIISAFPFFYIAIKLHKQQKEYGAFAALFLYFAMSWKWDLLTSIPRSLINGMPFAIIGAIFINEKSSSLKSFAGALLSCLGAVMTNSAGAITVIGFAYYLINIKKNHDQILSVASGALLSILVYVLIQNFYQINADFNLHGTGKGQLDFNSLLKNLGNITGILGTFCFVRPNWLAGENILVFGIILLIYLIKQRKWTTLTLSAVLLILFTGLCCMSKTNDYNKDSILFSQARMFLFVPYVVLTIMYFSLTSEAKVNFYVFLKNSKMRFVFIPLLLFILLFKIYPFEKAIRNTSSPLYNPYACGLFTTESLLNIVNDTIHFATENNCDVIVTKDGTRGFSYALGAIGYEKVTVYNAVYDRRTWVYHKLKHTDSHKVLLTDFNGNKEILNIEGISIVDYLAENYGWYRRPYNQNDKRTESTRED